MLSFICTIILRGTLRLLWEQLWNYIHFLCAEWTIFYTYKCELELEYTGLLFRQIIWSKLVSLAESHCQNEKHLLCPVASSHSYWNYTEVFLDFLTLLWHHLYLLNLSLFIFLGQVSIDFFCVPRYNMAIPFSLFLHLLLFLPGILSSFLSIQIQGTFLSVSVSIPQWRLSSLFQQHFLSLVLIWYVFIHSW